MACAKYIGISLTVKTHKHLLHILKKYIYSSVLGFVERCDRDVGFRCDS